MIVDAIFALCRVILDGLGSLLPDGTLDLPAATSVGAWIGEKAGPFDKVLPLHEGVTAIVILLTVWCPAALVYSTTFWIYRHLPVLGKG